MHWDFKPYPGERQTLYVIDPQDSVGFEVATHLNLHLNAAICAANSNKPGSTLWFLGVMAMYEGGLFDSVVAGSHPHQISAPGMAERVAHALRRGRQCQQDLLAIDYFTVADQPPIKLQ